MTKTTLATQSHLHGFPYKSYSKFRIFKTLMKYFLKALQGYNLSIHNRQFEPLKTLGRDLMTV